MLPWARDRWMRRRHRAHNPGREQTMKKLRMELDELKVDSFELSAEEGRKGTVMGNAASLAICSGSCTPAGSCFDGCYTASAARPYCY